MVEPSNSSSHETDTPYYINGPHGPHELCTAAGDVIYVYMHDGEVMSLLRNEITEMGYSTYDTLGVAHDEVVSQIISLGEEAYIIPLEDIDSISFVTPSTVYRAGVTRLDGELLQYVESCDSTVIHFAANTPSNLLPKVGDKLGFGDLTEKFPEGFAGVVKSVNGTTVICEYEEIEEIFETLYCVATSDISPGDNNARRRAFEIVTPYEKDLKIKPIEIDLTGSLKNVIKIGSYAFKGDDEIKAIIKPDLHFKAEIVLRQPFGLRFSGTLSGDVAVDTHTSVYGSLEFAKDLAWSDKFGNFYGFGIDFKIGGFAKISADVTANMDNRLRIKFSTGFALGTKGMVHSKPGTSFNVLENKTTINSASLDGLFGYGAVVELGIAWLKDKIAKGVFRAEFGPQYTGDIILTNKLLEDAKTSTALYDRLKDRTIKKYQVISTSWDFYAFEKYGTSLPAPWGSKQLTDEWDIVPKFSDTSLVQERGAKGTATGSATAKGDCAFEHTLGLMLQDSNGRYYDMEDWTMISDKNFKSGREDLIYTFKDLKDDDSETYKLYPMVMLGGVLPVLASPSADLEKNDFPVRIVSFEQTGSHYSKEKGFEYDGINYFYKFNATTTVELDKEAKNIKDWGYIYHDIYEVDKKISCANLGSNPYADTRYAYYFNEPSRSVILRPYVQYEGETEIQTGKTKIFGVEYEHSDVSSCPDDDHPHMIDLGLPSGTKWACCNVGAKEPKDDGYHFMFASTKPMSSSYHYIKTTNDRKGEGQLRGLADEDPIPTYWHEWATEEDWKGPDLEDKEDYEPYYDMSLFDNPPMDIGGTKYDAAKVHWGGAWRMPSQEQAQELVDNCVVEHVLTGNLSDPINFQLIGPNGKSIIIPSYRFIHKYEDSQSSIGGYRLVYEYHRNETNLWNSDTSRIKGLLLKYIYDWYNPMTYKPDLKILEPDYPQPEIIEESEEKLYLKHMTELFPVRPVAK